MAILGATSTFALMRCGWQTEWAVRENGEKEPVSILTTKFIDSKTWEGGAGTGDELDIGPSLGQCATKPPKQRKEPEYLPVSSAKHTGKVTFYNAERGFGRINGDLFFHISGFVDGNSGFVEEGVTVAYEEGVDKRGRPQAVDIQLCSR